MRTKDMTNERTGATAEKRSLKEQVYEALLAKLLNNELVPGQILNRRAVAEELGVSVAPVLEAMLQLRAEGFLESIARKGTQVRPIGQKDIVGMLVVRAALECQAARLYCGESVEAELDRLLPLARELESDAAGHPHHWMMDLEFHTALVSLADCPMLSDEYRRCIHLNMFFGINRFYPRAAEHGRMSHESLLRELTTRDPDAAEQIIRRHIRSGKGPFAELIR